VAWLTLSAVVVGLLNYGYSLSLTWLLPVAAYSVYATGQALLLVGGTVSAVSTPWVLSRELSRAPDDAAARRAAVSFAVLVGLSQGLLAAAAAALVATRFSSRGVPATIALAMLATFCAANVVGYLQGLQRFRAIVGMRLVEVLGKLASGLGLVVLGVGAAGALGGFGIGSLAVVALGLGIMRRDLRPRLASLRHAGLWRQALGLGAIQGVVALLANLDVVLAGALGDAGSGLASFQVSTILARIPLFLSVAVSTVAFPKLSAGREAPSRVISSSMDMLLRAVVPVSLLVATVPSTLIGAAFPAQYAAVGTLLPYTAVTGALVGVVNLVTTFFQAERRFARCTVVLVVGLPVHAAAILIGLRGGEITGLAVGALMGAALITLGLLAEAERTWPGVIRLRRSVVAGWLVAAPLPLLNAHPLLWMGWAAVVVAAAAWNAGLRSGEGPASAADAPEGGQRLRVLHLAFEDHRRPGSGGGAIRTHEINRRLAERHDVTVVTSRYRGCRERVEDGVRYVHVGVAAGYFGSILAYFLALPLALRRYPSDLVVEDFAAPFSSVLVPWWTRRPVVGVVQWLFARQKSLQYKLPFFLVEALGVRAHRRMVAVSAELASELRSRNGKAHVDVVHNGVAPELFTTRARKGNDLVFLGRVEIAQKGLDMLLEAFASAAARLDVPADVRLLVAGDGPDVEAIRQLIRRLGLEGRVELVGRVEGEAKRELLASARLVCMPSRYETFGMVAAEAMACGTPVLAFDIPCLREVLPPEAGVLIPAFDVDAFATALADLAGDPDRCAAMGEAGRAAARRFDWEPLARRQEEVYREAVRARGGSPSVQLPPPASSAVLGPALVELTRVGRLAGRRGRAARPRVLLFGNYGNTNVGFAHKSAPTPPTSGPGLADTYWGRCRHGRQYCRATAREGGSVDGRQGRRRARAGGRVLLSAASTCSIDVLDLLIARRCQGFAESDALFGVWIDAAADEGIPEDAAQQMWTDAAARDFKAVAWSVCLEDAGFRCHGDVDLDGMPASRKCWGPDDGGTAVVDNPYLDSSPGPAGAPAHPGRGLPHRMCWISRGFCDE
jgi:glycosyltransferase involved in cell wall biosynthesis/O-antigen/teichoic acid export membrane protein